jgi:cytochrome c oxidase cbb3-type subunit III
MLRLLAIALSVLVLPAPAAAQPGRQLFQRECAGCHGPGGEGGRGPTLATPKLLRAPDLKALLQIVDDGVPGTEMPGARLSATEVRQVALWVQKLGRRPIERLPGDPARGQVIYAGKGGCTVCHSVAGHGGATGPDLSDVGLKRGAAHLRASLIDPDVYIPASTSGYRSDVPISTNFLQVRAVLADGRELLGVRVNEDTFSIQIRDASNRVHSLWKADLKQLDKQWGRTPMPSYKEALTGAELDDLVAYLATLRSRD